jgi:hypothetical protein
VRAARARFLSHRPMIHTLLDPRPLRPKAQRGRMRLVRSHQSDYVLGCADRAWADSPVAPESGGYFLPCRPTEDRARSWAECCRSGQNQARTRSVGSGLAANPPATPLALRPASLGPAV